MKEYNKKENKVYLRFIDGEYYGDSFDWEVVDIGVSFNDYKEYNMYCPRVDTKDARLYTIEAIKYHLDELSEFIKPSALLDFIKTIEDTNTGKELYDNLQENVMYVLNITMNVLTKAQDEKSSDFNDYVFGKHFSPYDTESECHLCLFGDPDLLMLWVKPHKQFVEEFKQRLKYKQDLYLLAYDDESLRQSNIEALKERIKNWERERDRINLNIEADKKKLKELEGDKK